MKTAQKTTDSEELCLYHKMSQDIAVELLVWHACILPLPLTLLAKIMQHIMPGQVASP